MTAPPQPRRRRPRLPVAKWVLAAALALLGVLAPIESSSLPSPLDEISGTPHASAQTPPPPPTTSPPPPTTPPPPPSSNTVIDGLPDPCPDPQDPRWAPNAADPSLCEIRYRACPENPLPSPPGSQPNVYLALSVEYPDFCEITFLESADPAMYQACSSLTGYVVQLTFPSTGRQCRLIAPTRCPAQLHRTGLNTCLRVRRRTWSCPAGSFHRNQFNTCYEPPPAYLGTNPACQSGAPAFPLVSCEKYVGGDFERNPTNVPCSSFPTGNSPVVLQDHTANQHWCRYNSSFLDVGCHAAGAACPTSADAYCIKRASRTGGCDVVAETLRCRDLQADFRDPNVTLTANDVFQQGCTPCVLLPFESVPPECPGRLRRSPARSSNYWHEQAHIYQDDWIAGSGQCVRDEHDRGIPMDAQCLNRLRCLDPPRGRIVWESSHHSGFAIVNSLITLRIEDIPIRTRWVPRLSTNNWRIYPGGELLYLYSDTNDDIIVRTWYTADASQAYTNVANIASGGECILKNWPDFRIQVEELWPDNDEVDIEDLLGAGTLDWWRSLTPLEQQRHTEARGLEYVAGMTPAQRKLELDRRADTLNQEVRCNYGHNMWCQWEPPRPGYYRLTAAGGWDMRIFTGVRRWRQPHQLRSINDFVQNFVSAGDGSCTAGSAVSQGEDYDCIMLQLQRMGVDPDEIGLEDDPVNMVFTGIIFTTPTQDGDWLYSAAAGEYLGCPPLDLRISCGSSASGTNYTESEPIGIRVHEIRVNTVTPTR